MQGLILPVSYRFLLSSLHRRKTWSEITKLRREGNAISVGSHSPHWGRSAPGSQGVSGLWKGPVHCRRREVLQIPNIWEGKKKKKTSRVLRNQKLFLRLDAERAPHCFPVVCPLPAPQARLQPPALAGSLGWTKKIQLHS